MVRHVGADDTLVPPNFMTTHGDFSGSCIAEEDNVSATPHSPLPTPLIHLDDEHVAGVASPNSDLLLRFARVVPILRL